MPGIFAQAASNPTEPSFATLGTTPSTTQTSTPAIAAPKAPLPSSVKIPTQVAPPVVTPQQDAAAKSSVLDDITKAPDNSTLGVIKNTILGIPKAAATVLPSIGQGIARDVGAAAVTAMGKDSVPIAGNDKLSQFLFGSQPIPSLYENGKNYMIQNGTNPKVAAVEGLPFGMMLAISDVYAGPEEDAIKSIASAGEENTIKGILDANYPALSEQSPQLAKTLAGVSDPNQVSQIVKDALNKTAHVAVEDALIPSNTVFHGTKGDISDITKSEPLAYGDPQALYGPGTYLTDNKGIASGYSKTKGSGDTGKVLAGDLKPDLKFLNLDQKLSPQEAQIFNEEINRPIGDLMEGDHDVTGKTGAEAIQILRENLSEAHIPKYEAAESFYQLQQRLGEEHGYDGFAHVGGVAKGTPHNVKILFDYGDSDRPISSKFSASHGVVDEPDITYAPEEEEGQTTSVEKSAEQHEAMKDSPVDIPENVLPEDKAVTGEAPAEHGTTPEEMAESQRLADEATARSTEFLENWGNEDIPDKYDVQPGTWQSMLKDFSRNLPGESKVDILDYLRTPEHVLERVGLQRGAELLQDAKDSYRTTLAKELDKIGGWKKEIEQDGSPDSSRRIFKYLDGEFKDTKHEMTPAEYAMAQKIKAYFKQWADRLGLPEENRVSNYVTHLFADNDEHGESVFDDPELKNIMAGQPAKSVYDPFLQKRINKPGYKQDVWAALDAYVKRGTRKEAFDPALANLEKMARGQDDSVYKYVTQLTHQINMRPADLDTLVDNLLKKTPGIGGKIGDRPVNRITSKLRAIFNRASVGLNIRSSIRILAQGANTYAKLGEKYTVLGYYDFIKNAVGRNLGDLVDSGVLKDTFLQDRKAGVYKSSLQKIEPALYTLFDTADKITRGSAFYGARRQALKKGLSMEQATLYAKRIVRDTHFDFSPVNSSVGTPFGLKGDITKSAMQFLDYTQRQGEFVTDMLSHGIGKAVKGDAAGATHELLGLLRWGAVTYLFASTIGKAIGYTTADILPALTADTNPLVRTGGDVVTGVGDAMSGNLAGAGTEALDVAGSFIPGYSQGKNTVTGVSDVASGKVKNSSGQTVAQVPQTPGNYVKGALFGPTSLSLDQQSKLTDIYSLLDKQSKGSGATKAANTEYQKLNQIYKSQGSDAANAAFQELEKTNPDQAKLVRAQIEDEKSGITADEIAMKKLSTTNRAQYLAQEFNGMSDNSQRQALWEKYVSDKVITPAVSKALSPLLKNASSQ